MANELQQRGGASRANWSNQRSASVPFFIKDIRYDQIEWNVGGMPQKGDGIGGNAASVLRAREFSASEMGDNSSSLVIVLYSTADIAHGGAPPPTPTGSSSLFSGTWSDAIVEIPYGFLREIYLDISDPLNIEKTKVWDSSTGAVRETRYTISAHWEVTSPDWMDFAAIGKQHNKVHQIGGDKYLFRAGSLEPKDEILYEFRGTWELDTGTPQGVGLTGHIIYPLTGYRGPPTPNDPWEGLEFLTTAGGTEPAVGLMRDPYHELVPSPPQQVVVPGTVIEQLEPITVYHRRMYDEDLLGWKTLPNVPSF